MSDRREYLRKYQAVWIKKRREQWVAEHGPCEVCGSSDRLEVDHRNPADKSYAVAALWSRAKDFREAELAKCRVLCYLCHKRKTGGEIRASRSKPITHGTQAGYRRRCRCDECKACYSAAKKRSRKKLLQTRGFYL